MWMKVVVLSLISFETSNERTARLSTWIDLIAILHVWVESGCGNEWHRLSLSPSLFVSLLVRQSRKERERESQTTSSINELKQHSNDTKSSSFLVWLASI